MNGEQIARNLVDASYDTLKEAKQLQKLIDAYMTPGGNCNGDWHLKITSGGDYLWNPEDGYTYETSLSNKKGIVQKWINSSNKEAEIPSTNGTDNDTAKKWTDINPSDISNNGEESTAQQYFNLLLGTKLTPNSFNNKDNLEKYVNLLIALKNSSAFQRVSSNSEKQQLDVQLRNIYNDRQKSEKLSVETRKKIEGAVDTSVDDSGNPVTTIYTWPERQETEENVTEDDPIDQIVTEADTFLTHGSENQINNDEMKKNFNSIYNMFFQIGVGLTVIVGLVLGIKFMLAGLDEKADIKKMLSVYAIACVVIFGSFGIWKLIINILASL